MATVKVQIGNDNQRAAGKKMIAAWVDSALFARVESMAKSSGLTVSDILIRALSKK